MILTCEMGGGPRPEAFEEVLAALKAMTRTFLDGTHYETTNPYCRPVVRKALIAIAHAEDKSTFGSDWMDALSLTDEETHK